MTWNHIVCNTHYVSVHTMGLPLQLWKMSSNLKINKQTKTSCLNHPYSSDSKLAWSVDQEAADNSSNYCIPLFKATIYSLLLKKIISKNEGYFLAVIITSWLIYSDNQRYYTMKFFFHMIDFINCSLAISKLSCYTKQRSSLLWKIWNYEKIWHHLKSG